jgi:eukaryotic-like serine/threonine-protein kinase
VKFWQHLKERRLFQIVVAYLAGGWIVLEAVSQLTERGIVPPVVYVLTLIWFLFGLAIALVMGWFHGEKGAQRVTKLEAVLLAVILFGGIGASSVPISSALSERMAALAAASGLNLNRIAVLYFDDLTPDGGASYIADGLTESLIDELSTVRDFDIISRNGVAPFRGEADIGRVGSALEAGTLVRGSVEQVNGNLRVTLRLLDGHSGQEFNRTSFTHPLEQLDRAREAVAEESAVLLRDWLGREVRLRRSRLATASVPAWALFQRGEEARKRAEQASSHGDDADAERQFDLADSLLAQAEVLDRAWAEPPLLRAHVAYRRARIVAIKGHRYDAAALIQEGLPHVERAIEQQPTLARAYEVRGALKYLYRLLEVEHDRGRLDRVWAEAKADLEQAIKLDPSLASAHAMLGHLYHSVDRAAAMIASRRAYEEDAYLENADVIVDRIFWAAYHLEQFGEASRWCDIGQRRFPENHRFAMCALVLLTTPGETPDVDLAWSLLARLDSLSPGHQADVDLIEGELFVGGVLARAGAADSARATWARARAKADPHVDPTRNPLRVEAYVRTLVGDDDEAIDLLKIYAAVNQGASFENTWWFRSLRQHPRWSELAATTYH